LPSGRHSAAVDRSHYAAHRRPGEATRRIAAGELGYQVAVADKTEFGELSSNFNFMSTALKDGYAKLETEIAERRQTEAALTGSESFLNNIFNSIHDPFCIFDRNYRIVRANDAYAELKRVQFWNCRRSLRRALCRPRTATALVQKTFYQATPARRTNS
jgi:PAS domain-containing protein